MTRLESLNQVCSGLGGASNYTDELSVWQAIQTQMNAIVAVLNGISGDTETTYQAAMSKVVIGQGGTGAGDVLTLCNELATIIGAETQLDILAALNAIITELEGTPQSDILAAYTELGTLLQPVSQPFATFTRTTENTQINMAFIYPSEPADMTIDWGDGNVELFDETVPKGKSGEVAIFPSHEYLVDGDYDIFITGGDLGDAIQFYTSSPGVTVIDVSQLTALQYLSLYNTSITEIDLMGLTALQTLDLSNTSITEIDLTGLTALQTLNLNDTAITEVDLTGLTALQNLDLQNTPITEVDLTGLTALQYLYLNDTDVDPDDVLAQFAILFEFCTYVDLSGCGVPTPATLLTAQTANPQCTFTVDTE